jgi:diguanylate cyclase (GGDEF)-like protein
MRLLVGTLCLLCALTPLMAVARAPLDQVSELREEMHRLQDSQPKIALSKGEEALTLLADKLDPKLELTLLEEVANLQFESGLIAPALKSQNAGVVLATTLSDTRAQRSLRVMLAAISLKQGNYTEATKVAAETLVLARAANDLANSVKSLIVLGQSAGSTGDFPHGVQYLQQGLELSDKIDEPELRQRLLAALSSFYIDTQEWTKALKFNQEAFLLATEMGNKSRQTKMMLNASLIYARMNQPDDELRTMLAAEALSKTLDIKSIQMSVEVNLSDVLLQRKDYKGALERADHGLAMALELNDETSVAVALINRGTALNRMGQHSAGLAALEQGLAKMLEADAVAVLGDIAEEYAFAGDFRRAFEYQKTYKEKNDKIFHDAKTKAQQELEARYQSEKQEKQILQLTLESDRRALVRNFSIAGGALGLALALALLARYRLLRRSSDQMQLLNGKLENLTVTDPLTGLRNRRFFMQHVEQFTAETTRAHFDTGLSPPADSNQDLIFYMIDLDHFKYVNDTYGHNAGDLVLKQAVARLSKVIRDSDELIRWGGEEFLLVARKSNRRDAPILAERLRAAIAAGPFDLGESRFLERTCSIGFAAFPLRSGMPERPSWEAVVELADQALYVAKSSGRNGWLGVAGAQQATSDMLEAQLPQGLHSLVEQGLCDVRHSFPVSTTLVWEKKSSSPAQEPT